MGEIYHLSYREADKTICGEPGNSWVTAIVDHAVEDLCAICIDKLKLGGEMNNKWWQSGGAIASLIFALNTIALTWAVLLDIVSIHGIWAALVSGLLSMILAASTQSKKEK